MLIQLENTFLHANSTWNVLFFSPINVISFCYLFFFHSAFDQIQNTEWNSSAGSYMRAMKLLQQQQQQEQINVLVFYSDTILNVVWNVACVYAVHTLLGLRRWQSDQIQIWNKTRICCSLFIHLIWPTNVIIAIQATN